MKIKSLIILLLTITLLSCTGKKKSPAFHDPDAIDLDSSAVDDQIIEPNQNAREGDLVLVPYRQENGVKYVDVAVNGAKIEMIFDTGASTSLISIAEANYFYQKGYLTTEDYIGQSQSQIADGRIVENMIFKLKEVVIGNKIQCIDVMVTVSANNNAPLLLGNDILDRVASYTIDNENKLIKFKLK